MRSSRLKTFEALSTPTNYYKGVQLADPLQVDNVVIFYRRNLPEGDKQESMRWLHSRHMLVTNFGTPGIAHIDMTPYRVDCRNAILIRPYEFHFFTALERSLCCWLFMTFDTDTPIAFRSKGNPVITLDTSQQRKLEQLAEWSGQRKYQSLCANEFIAHTSAFLESLRLQWNRRKASDHSQTTGAPSSLLGRIYKMVKAEPALSLSISQLAARSGCSERHLRRVFRETIGMPLGEFLKDYRISRIIQLVSRDGLSLVTAANICGYSSPSALTRAFKLRTGLTPRDFFKRATSR